MIRYPYLPDGATISITAPSSGVRKELEELVKQAVDRMESKGFRTVIGETVWTQEKAKSAPALIRAEELNNMLQDEEIDLIFPPWGGELLIEILEYLEFENVPPKWILGYSDTSVLLLALTLKTGIATAHGTNLVDLRGEQSDPTTSMWHTVLQTKHGETVNQYSSENYQKKWQHDNPTPWVFHLTERTKWKSISDGPITVKGRLLGGCVDVIRHLIGTPYGDIATFRKDFINNEPIIWYFENCDLSTTDLRRSLVQMKYAGWFENCYGILFGRSPANQPVENYNIEDVYEDLAQDLGIPIIYDIDCGHVPPQITFINGASAEVIVEDGQGTVIQSFN
ncbi:S66 family peptidase [Sporosarcina highlanderae]|uniref:LD-carboxypeptidase n=1 Tax=Sporosarcina highlanderae TaxID=3035916 RepID=A0ABT8JV69_9BACL|nr:S66 peptidase family protein [Sporosarcina highlanderae]MDN4608446.1 LD-carboxypeptidase [Sporosarcina highlanderae]